MHLWILIITFCSITEALSKSCLDAKLEHEKNCQESDHENYVECVRKRMKRHSYNCRNDDYCFDCDCESCQYSECGGQCNECCNSCCSNYVQCHTNHCCHKQCHAECRTYNCRSTCRKACYNTISEEAENEIKQEQNQKITETLIRVNGGGSAPSNLQANTSNVNSHNITTVINLKNVINNTNLVDVPINLNYTNKNNITLAEAISGSSSGGSTGNDCCVVIGPRQCMQIQISPYVRCFHTRSRQCGSFCTSNIVHQEQTQVCNSFNAFGQPICQQQTAYIPQPQPKCSYTSTWPYVTCGIQPPAACEGCYGHYFNPQSKDYKSCPQQCYDDFSGGPLYRQGPFYQPAYSHVPPCYFSPQGCGGLAGSGALGGMGGLGNTGVMGAMTGGYAGVPGGYTGAFIPGFGGGFGYAAQPPIFQPNFLQPLPVPLNPQLPENSINLATANQTFPNYTGLLDPVIINEYQGDGPFLPLYDLPGKEVEIDVKITDANKTRYYQLPPMKKTERRHDQSKKINVVRL